MYLLLIRRVSFGALIDLYFCEHGFRNPALFFLLNVASVTQNSVTLFPLAAPRQVNRTSIARKIELLWMPRQQLFHPCTVLGPPWIVAVLKEHELAIGSQVPYNNAAAWQWLAFASSIWSRAWEFEGLSQLIRSEVGVSSPGWA